MSKQKNQAKSLRHKMVRKAVRLSPYYTVSHAEKLCKKCHSSHRSYYRNVVRVNVSLVAKQRNWRDIAKWIRACEGRSPTINPIRYGETPPEWLIIPWLQ